MEKERKEREAAVVAAQAGATFVQGPNGVTMTTMQGPLGSPRRVQQQVWITCMHTYSRQWHEHNEYDVCVYVGTIDRRWWSSE